MMRKALQLFCDNEHGTGDVTFPEDGMFDYEKNHSAAAVRRAAKAAGWRRIMKADYCPSCVECNSERD